ncbi:hypothetical protein [Lacticaseibacillus pantheris]|jgi:multisubunit Na+/H+ antiporter MnhB subunit|uniref:hypothetical protein n=1 Tax=Lacticaseibacillus pantheris TaxID=171523 RepID=UPI00265819BF|nr:hypothetical protein [Lacticaseibacillus pantheris]WKF85198.1 hypothetical protein QY874_00890 [Lacticaseibacillus pantheris]
MNIWLWIIAAVIAMIVTGWAMWGTADTTLARHEVTRRLAAQPLKQRRHKRQ